VKELQKLQQEFQDFVLNGREEFKESVEGNDEQFISTRMDIYYSAYRTRLAGVLKIDYPGLHTLAGDDQFEMICQDYINHYPSDHFSVRYFGRFMQEFLTKTEPYAEHRLLADMAGFEWGVSEVLDAEDRQVLSLKALHEISPALWPQMKIHFHPSLRIIPLQWKVAKFWQSVKEEKDPEAPENYPQAVKWVLWRKGVEVYFRSLEDDEAWLLESSIAGKSFAELCEGLCQWMAAEDVAARAAIFLQNWISEEMVSSIETS